MGRRPPPPPPGHFAPVLALFTILAATNLLVHGAPTLDGWQQTAGYALGGAVLLLAGGWLLYGLIRWLRWWRGR